MHIPDNYLSPQTCAVFTAAMVPAWAYATVKVRRELKPTDIPLIGLAAAFSFVVMMLNIPLPGGSSGHAVGSVLAGILLGPWAACLAVSVALLLQALLFGDGGILSFAANCFNMAFVMPLAGWLLFRLFSFQASGNTRKAVAAGVAAWAALVLASALAAVEFGLQPLLFQDAQGLPLYCPYPLSIALPAMVLPHVLVAGPIEGLFTAGVWLFMMKSRESSLPLLSKSPASPLGIVVALLVLIAPLGLLAAGTAWGEWGPDEIAATTEAGPALGMVPAGMAQGWNWTALIPDYDPSILPPALGYILSALIGVLLLVIGFRLVLGRLRSAKTGEGRGQ